MYNFKRDSKIYLVETNNPNGVYKHRIDIYSDLNFSQTFNEISIAKRTLHDRAALHEGVAHDKANPGNFNFTAPIFSYPAIQPILFKYATTVDSFGNPNYFDLYVQTTNEIFKIEKCVIESSVFNISKSEVLSLSISGSAKKLTRGIVSIPGTIVSSTQQYTSCRRVQVLLDGIEVDSIAALNVEFSNTIQWIDYSILTFNNDLVYPENYVLTGRTISGSINQFLTDNNKNLFVDYGNLPLNIKIYSDFSATPLLEFTFDTVGFTRRLGFNELINRVYDYRITSNSNTKILKYKGV